MPKTQVSISPEQYRALQSPVDLPSPQQLFDFMVERLVQKELASYRDADQFRKDLPTGLFLLVPLRPQEMDLSHLMSLVELDGKKGVNYLNLEYLKDEVETPRSFYLMLNVEDGAACRNTKPSVNRKNILAKGRSPHTTFEGIVHAIVFPEVLRHHYMDLVGSRFKTVHVPYLYLDGGRPKLYARWHDIAYALWSAPSCGSRVGS